MEDSMDVKNHVIYVHFCSMRHCQSVVCTVSYKHPLSSQIMTLDQRERITPTQKQKATRIACR